MRPQLVGFIKETLPGYVKPIITGIKLVDLDSILVYKDGRHNFLCPERLIHRLEEPRIGSKWDKPLLVRDEDEYLSYIDVADTPIKNAVIMNATVESVVNRLKSGVKIIGLTFNPDKVKTNIAEGLEGDIAPLKYYPYSLDGELQQDLEVVLDYQSSFVSYSCNSDSDLIVCFIINFNGDIGYKLFERWSSESILELNSDLANAQLVKSIRKRALTVVTRQELLESKQLASLEGMDNALALNTVIRKKTRNTLGFHGANLEEFLFLMDRLCATAESDNIVTLLGRILNIRDTQIEELYIPEQYLKLKFKVPAYEEGKTFSLRKIVSAEGYPLVFYDTASTFDKVLPNLEELELYHTDTLEGILNYYAPVKTSLPLNSATDVELIDRVPKLTLHGKVHNIEKSFNGFDICKISDEVLDLSSTELITIKSSFRNIKGIKKVILPASLTAVDSSFHTLWDLEELDFSRCVNIVELNDVGGGCPNLRRVVLPPNIATIKNSFSKCSNLSSIDGLNTGTLQNVKNSFNYSGIEKLLIISKLRLTLEDSFNNSRITDIELVSGLADGLGGNIWTCFLECTRLTKLSMNNIHNIRSSFSNAVELKDLSSLDGVQSLAESFSGLSVDTVTIPKSITCFITSLRDCKLDTVEFLSQSAPLNGGPFKKSAIERLNVHNSMVDQSSSNIRRIRFIDFKEGCNFSNFELILSDYVEFLLIPDCVASINWTNLSSGKYLRAVYISENASLKNKAVNKIGERVPGGITFLVTKKAKILRLIKSKGFNYQIVESQEEARQIMEKMYADRLEELGIADRQAKKLRFIGVEEEMANAKFALNYPKIAKIQAYLEQKFDYADLMPIDEENLMLAIPKDDFSYFDLDKSAKGNPDYSFILDTTSASARKSQRFRTLLHLFTHLGCRTDYFSHIHLCGKGVPDIKSTWKFRLPGEDSKQDKLNQSIMFTVGASNSRWAIPSSLLRYEDIFNAIFIEDDKIMLVSPLRTDMKVDPEFFTEEWAPVSKLLSPGDIIGDGSEDSTVMINYVELGKKVGRDFRYKFIHEHISLDIDVNGRFNGSVVFYSILSGMVIIANLGMREPNMSEYEMLNNYYLRILDDYSLKITIMEVYQSLDEFKEKNPERYQATKEAFLPKRYLEAHNHSFDFLINGEKKITESDYDSVEPCYEAILGKYLASCGVTSIENLNRVLLDNIFASELFVPKTLRKSTLDSFKYKTVKLCDGTLLTEFYATKQCIKVDSLALKAQCFTVITSTIDELKAKSIKGYLSYVSLIEEVTLGSTSINPLLPSLINLGTKANTSKKVEFVTDEDYNPDDFTTIFREPMKGVAAYWLLLINNASGIPFIGIAFKKHRKILFRLKNLGISHSNWLALTDKHPNILEGLVNSLTVNTSIFNNLTFLHGLIIEGITREELNNYRTDCISIIATQPEFAATRTIGDTQ